MDNLYFDLLPHDLIIELSLYLPLDAIKFYCKTFYTWRSICANNTFLQKYIAYTYNIPMNEVLKIPNKFFIDYINSTNDDMRFHIIIKYDFEPLFEYYLQDTNYGEELKEKTYKWHNNLVDIMINAIEYRANNIINYLMKVYKRDFNNMHSFVIYRIIRHIIEADNIMLLKYFWEELHYANLLQLYEIHNLIDYAASVNADRILEYLEDRYNI